VAAFPVRVASNTRATPTTRRLLIDLGGRPFDFSAGQWVKLGADAGAARPYSIASAPAEAARAGRLEFLIRVDGSGADLALARRGTRLHLDGPHGRFCLPSALEGHLLFVGGGTGIAPLRAMLLDALGSPARPRCSLLYSARTSREFTYLSEFRALTRAGRLELVLAVTRDLDARWKGVAGRIGRLHLESVVRGRDTTALVCGPDTFVGDVRTALEELGVRRIRGEGQ